MLILIVLINIIICIVLIVLSVHTVLYIYFWTRIVVETETSASEPRCSIILVHVICLTFVSTHVYFDNKIQFNQYVGLTAYRYAICLRELRTWHVSVYSGALAAHGIIEQAPAEKKLLNRRSKLHVNVDSNTAWSSVGGGCWPCNIRKTWWKVDWHSKVDEPILWLTLQLAVEWLIDVVLGAEWTQTPNNTLKNKIIKTTMLAILLFC